MPIEEWIQATKDFAQTLPTAVLYLTIAWQTVVSVLVFVLLSMALRNNKNLGQVIKDMRAEQDALRTKYEGELVWRLAIENAAASRNRSAKAESSDPRTVSNASVPPGTAPPS